MLQGDINSMISLGAQASQYPVFLDHFFYSFGKQLFQNESIAERIDFLVLAAKDDILDQTIEIICPKKDIFALNDLHHVFGLGENSGNTTIVVTNKNEDGTVYSIRGTIRSGVRTVMGKDLKIKGQMYYNIIEEPGHFWNFTNFNKQIEIHKPTKAFLNPYQTRAAANMIIWTSNRLGFESVN